jgi:hypothetical protein
VLENIASQLGTSIGYLRAVTDDPLPYGLTLAGDQDGPASNGPVGAVYPG